MTAGGWVSVWKRNRDVFARMFLVNFLLPILEPVFYLLAFGLGLGAFVREIGGVPYRIYIAPGIVAMAAVSSSFFYTTYSSYVKMFYQKTFDAIIATPVSIEEVVAGEIMWGATRGFIGGVVVLAVFTVAGLVPLRQAILFLPLLAVLGFSFSALGMFFTAVTTSIENFNYPIFLYFTPMTFFSGTFFPVEHLPGWAVASIRVLFPLSHGMTGLRGLMAGDIALPLLVGCIPLVHGVALSVISAHLMRKRLIV